MTHYTFLHYVLLYYIRLLVLIAFYQVFLYSAMCILPQFPQICLSSHLNFSASLIFHISSGRYFVSFTKPADSKSAKPYFIPFTLIIFTAGIRPDFNACCLIRLLCFLVRFTPPGIVSSYDSA